MLSASQCRMVLSASILLAGAVACPAGAEERIVPVRGFMCSSAAYAMRFADELAAGKSDEIAKDRVGRVAKAEVCGLYVGPANVQSEEVRLAGGTAYKLTAFRFERDHRVAWLVERSFAPTATNWDL